MMSRAAVLLLTLLVLLALPSSPAQAFEKLEERYALVLGGEPKDLLPDPAGNRLFVSDFVGGKVAEVDLATGLVRRRLEAGPRPAGMALDPTGSFLYVAAYEGSGNAQGKLHRFDLATGLRETGGGLEDPWAIDIVTGPAGALLLAVTEHHGDRVGFYDPVSLELKASLGTASYPYHLAVDVARRRLYVASYGGALGGELMAINLDTLKEVWRRRTGKGTFDVQVDAQTGRVLVTDYTVKALELFAADGAKSGTLSLAGRPKGAALSDPSGQGYVVLQDLGLVTAYDLGGGGSLWSTPVGHRPAAAAWVSPPALGNSTAGLAGARGPLLAVANENDGTVSLLSPGEPVPEFNDVPSAHPYHRDIRVLALRGALNGYAQPGGAFAFYPERTVMRAQMAKILVGALSLHTEEIDSAAIEFADVPADGLAYPFDWVQEAARHGLVLGKPGSPPRFAPWEPLSRIQLLRMTVRAAAALDSSLPAAGGASPFADVAPGDPDWSTIMAAYRAGLIEAVLGADGKLRLEAHSPATRAVTARAVAGLLGALEPGG